MADLQTSPTVVAPSLRALLSESIDYAGTFPPADLSLDDAVANYATYRRSNDAWMLGGFVYSAPLLEEMTPYQTHFRGESPFRFNVLAGERGPAVEVLRAFNKHLDGIDQFRNRYHDRILIDSIETVAPAALLTTDVITIRRFINDIATSLDRYALQHADLFVELPLDENLRQTLPIVTGAIKAFNRERPIDARGRACIKMRAGGLDADAIPSLQSVAFLISTCRSAGVRMKATAGLHHPFRHFSPDVGGEMHGFLNVFAAATFALADDCSEDVLVEVLSDQDPSSFSFEDEALTWNGLRAGIKVIEAARRNLLASFGSCSFEEPVDDLRSLGLI